MAHAEDSMARRLHIQIQPRISGEMKDLLDRECRERRVSQGEIIDAALEAFFHPEAQEQSRYEMILVAIKGLRELILAQGLEPPAPAVATVPVQDLSRDVVGGLTPISVDRYYPELQGATDTKEPESTAIPVSVKPTGQGWRFLRRQS